MSGYLEPFPEDIWNEIREYPGNHKCCDCPSLDSDWGSVSHGTLICLECAGKHRSLGVHVSFVRSIRMDSWSKEQIEMMKQGGNDQVRRFFKKLEIENSPIQTLYCSKGANHYRERLKERVDKIMKGEIISEKRVVPKAHVPKLIQHIDEVKLVPTSHGDTLNIVFKDGPMGMTLTKDYKDMAVVSKLVPGGAAQCSGVLVGDIVIGISGKAIENYDEIMHMIPCMNRPLTIKFVRKSVQAKHHHQNPAAVHPSRSEPSLTHSAMNNAFADGYKQPPADGHKSGSSSRSNSKDNLPAAGGPTTPPGPSVRTKNSSTAKVKSSSGGPRIARANSASDGEDTVVSNASILKKSPRGFDKVKLKTSNNSTSSMTGGGGGGAAVGEASPGHSGSSSPLVQSSPNSPHSAGAGSPVVHHTASEVKQRLVFNSISKENLAGEAAGAGGDEEEPVGPADVSFEAASSRSRAVEEALESQIDEELFEGEDDEEGEPEDDDDNDEEEEQGSEEEEQEERPKRFVLEPGVIVKVLVEDKWRSAVIKRKHKDGTFKVLFRDDTSESHVPVSRMALPSSRAAEVVPGLALDTDEINNDDEDEEDEDEEEGEEGEDKTEYPDIISPNPYNHSSSGYYAAATHQPAIEDEGEFIVGSSEVDLDSFLEEESTPVAIIHNSEGSAAGSSRRSKLSPIKQPSSSVKGSGKTQGIGSSANEVDAASIGSSSTSGGVGGSGVKGETNVVKDILVTFERPPLGLTLTANAVGEPEISKIVEGGQAQEKGLLIGDVLMMISHSPASVYEVAMRILPGCGYPLELKFRRGNLKSMLERSGEALLKNSMELANRIKDSMSALPGLSKTSIMAAPYSERLSNSHREKVGSAEKKATVPATTMAVTSRFLSRTPVNTNEVDIEFTEPELGFRLEEYISHETYSTVTHVTDNSAAKTLGVRIGWILLGINFEKYISHAHSVATLKYAKRPVTIRFKTK